MNERAHGGMNNKELLRNTDPFIYKRNIKSVIKNTKWKYSGLDHFKGRFMNIDDYLYAYEKYQVVELISKMGLDSMLRDIVCRVRRTGGIYSKYLDMSKNDLDLIVIP